MSGLYNHFRIDVDIYKFILILGEGAKKKPRGEPDFLSATIRYICRLVGWLVGPKSNRKFKFKFLSFGT